MAPGFTHEDLTALLSADRISPLYASDYEPSSHSSSCDLPRSSNKCSYIDSDSFPWLMFLQYRVLLPSLGVQSLASCIAMSQELPLVDLG
jgi:hypothetical protein